jgi:putative SOS response-associated peptidase YedK
MRRRFTCVGYTGPTRISRRPRSGPHSEWWKPRFNVAPTQPAPVVTLHDGKRTIEMMRWGLVPFWAEGDVKKPPLMINARVETLKNKAFSATPRPQRCLVPADRFFEWKRDDSDKKTLPSTSPGGQKTFAFVGCGRGRRPRRAPSSSLHHHHRPPNELIEPIHDRCRSSINRYDAWLDPNVDGDAARAR